MGLSMIGAICVPINTAYRRDEMAYILNNAETRVVVSHHNLIDVAQEAAAISPTVRERVVVVDDDEAYPGWTSFWPFLHQTRPISYGELPQVTPKDLSMLVYTSGTTGNPKGVMITHEMYVAAGQGFAVWTHSTGDDLFFTCLPYFHANLWL